MKNASLTLKIGVAAYTILVASILVAVGHDVLFSKVQKIKMDDVTITSNPLPRVSGGTSWGTGAVRTDKGRFDVDMWGMSDKFGLQEGHRYNLVVQKDRGWISGRDYIVSVKPI